MRKICSEAMLILCHFVLLHIFVAVSVCGDGESSEKTTGKSYKPEYSGAVGTYSRGGLYGQSSVVASHHGHETAAEGCNMEDVTCLSMVSQDRFGLEAIKSLHGLLDDDADGNVDFSESDEFLREDLKYEDGYQRRQQAFHRNDDKHISVRELWDAWARSEVHNWTVEQTTDWLTSSVELPQYVNTFKEHMVTGATLPRLAVSNSHYLTMVLGIKDPIHKQKISLKAMDVVLFGPPKDLHQYTKDVILVTLVMVVLLGFYYVYRQHKSSCRDLQRMTKDLDTLRKAEQTLEDLQVELEAAKKEHESVAQEKLNLERRLLEQAGDGEGMRLSYSDLEVSQLKAEVEMLRMELQRAEGELQDRCWSPPVGLQHWLQLTYEIENKAYIKKRISAEKQLQQAREACEKLRKKRSSLVGAFVSTHGKSIDDVDRSIVEARTSLNEVTSELQERVYRWKQIELLCGFNIINNSGLQYLESVLYRSAPNGGRGLRGRMSASQDDLDDDSGSIYTPSGALESWKEDSSGSEQGKNEIDDDFPETRSLPSNVHFIVGGDSWADDLPPIPVVPKRTYKSSMLRSYSQDTNVNALSLDKERDREVPSNQSKLSQSDTNLEATVPSVSPRLPQTRSFPRDSGPDAEESGVVQRPTRRLLRDVTFESDDIASGVLREMEERIPVMRKLRDASDDIRRSVRDSSQEELRRPRTDDFRKISRETPEENVRRLAKLKEEIERLTADSGTAVDEDAHSTDSNSATGDDVADARRRKRKIFGHFRKDRAKPS